MILAIIGVVIIFAAIFAAVAYGALKGRRR